MKYKNTDFSLTLAEMSPTAFKKFFDAGGYSGKWDEAYKALGGKVPTKKD